MDGAGAKGYQRPATSDQEESGEWRVTGGEPEKEKQIPPLRGPTRQKAARKKKSGRSGRDDSQLDK
jgi:hypothetical protein